MANGASLSAASNAFGQGGAIKLNADKIEVDSGSSIESHAYAAGDAGSIQVQATSLQLTGGFMTSGAEQEGRAGSIDLDLTESLTLGQAASISVSSAKADGGAGCVSILDDFHKILLNMLSGCLRHGPEHI